MELGRIDRLNDRPPYRQIADHLRAAIDAGQLGPGDRLPDLMIGIEYEGLGSHTEPYQVLRDVGRYTGLVDKGWRIYRYTKFEIRRRRDLVVAQLTRARERARRPSA